MFNIYDKKKKELEANKEIKSDRDRLKKTLELLLRTETILLAMEPDVHAISPTIKEVQALYESMQDDAELDGIIAGSYMDDMNGYKEN